MVVVASSIYICFIGSSKGQGERTEHEKDSPRHSLVFAYEHDKDIQVLDCNMKTGDDYISTETRTENIYASRITCGQGPRITVGRLGDNSKQDMIMDDVKNPIIITELIERRSIL
jgi:hypothetical protein